jgi:hypothetical protein
MIVLPTLDLVLDGFAGAMSRNEAHDLEEVR